MNHISKYIFRAADSFSGGLIAERGARAEDELKLNPPQGGIKTVILNRTEYTICSHRDFAVTVLGSQIFVPSVGSENYSFSLKLVGESRYLLVSHSDIPFKLNGSYGYCSFIERGDRVMLGFTELSFRPPSSATQVAENTIINKRAAQSKLSILIQGETGTGKTTLAKEIHQLSGRGGSFIHLNLAAFSEGLIESEIFGHVKGAFTGAVRAKGGALLDSHRGTLFLDEVDSLSLTLQTKLLLFLDSMEFRPVGGSSYRSVDTRLIFASGQNLDDLVRDGRMRKDFYYRLASGLEIQLAPIREESGKIESVMKSFGESHGVSFDRSLITLYKKLKWPGNVRQLISHLRRKKVMSKRGHLVIDQFDHELEQWDESSASSIKTLEEMKRDYVQMVFKKLGQSRKRTLEALQISPPTLRTMMAIGG